MPSMAWAMASRWHMPREYARTFRSMAAPRPATSSASARWEPSAGRPVARQYRSRLARPDRCGRKPGPSTNEPSRDSAGDPGCTRRPKIVIVPACG